MKIEEIDQVVLVMQDVPSWKNGARELTKSFFPNAKVAFEGTGDLVIQTVEQSDQIVFAAQFDQQELKRETYRISEKPVDSNEFKGFFYRFMSDIASHTLPWGSLTGIKPVKIAHELLLQNRHDEALALKDFQDQYFVSTEKAELALDIAKNEMPIVYPNDSKKISLYIGVPICPAKCAYCSFVSTVADKKGKLCADYLRALLIEIKAFAKLIHDQWLSIDTLYIGGGTPSIFSAEQLEVLLKAVSGEFDLSNIREFTFEAGRPETTTLEKLKLLKQYHVNRLCLNPQSMNDATLRAVGRLHTAEDIRNVYQMISEIGFDCVNMDLIVGLNEEPPEMVLSSLQQVIQLHPENLTVHSLAIKKGSRLREEEGCQYEQIYSKDFYDEISNRLKSSGYRPYYLYRQKYAQGNGENIGYCLNGSEGIYNILMMAERQTIIGIGAGATGKVYHPEQNRLNKVYTVKDIRTYNARAEEIIAKKIKAYRQYLEMDD